MLLNIKIGVFVFKNEHILSGYPHMWFRVLNRKLFSKLKKKIQIISMQRKKMSVLLSMKLNGGQEESLGQPKISEKSAIWVLFVFISTLRR